MGRGRQEADLFPSGPDSLASQSLYLVEDGRLAELIERCCDLRGRGFDLEEGLLHGRKMR